MPNYQTHAGWGRVGAFIVALAVGSILFVAFDSRTVAVIGIVGSWCTTFVGAIFPDIDQDGSIPRRKAARSFGLLVAMGVVALVWVQYDTMVSAIDTTDIVAFSESGTSPAVVIAVGTVITSILVATFADATISLLTHEHRGWTHNVYVLLLITAVMVTVIVVLTDGLAATITGTLIGSSFFLGCLIHLRLDKEL